MCETNIEIRKKRHVFVKQRQINLEINNAQGSQAHFNDSSMHLNPTSGDTTNRSDIGVQTNFDKITKKDKGATI